MGLRYIFSLWVIGIFLCAKSSAISPRYRRQVNTERSPEAKLYQPPLLLGAPPPSVPIQNSYNPPIPLGRAIDPTSHQSHNQFEHGYIHSISPSNGVPSHRHEPITPLAATSYSVHQQPSYSEASGLQQSSAESHSKAVSHVPVQSIQKAPASEIQSEKGPAAKEKDNKNDEYVVYYYYYYDNDTTPNNNLSLNFDDIPSLEVFDEDKNGKEPQKSASARTLAANINSVVPVSEEQNGLNTHPGSSQPRSASGPNKDTVIKSDRPEDFEDSFVQPLKPVSNIYRYGANEVPRFPVIPNFIVSEVPTTTKANDVMTPSPVATEFSPTPESLTNSQFPNLVNTEDEDDIVNNVLDHSSVLKSSEEKSAEEEPTTTLSTTDLPTTTEPTTTTTEKSSRRRPSINSGRRRFNQSPSTFSSTRTRAPVRGSTSSSSTSTSTSTTTSAPARRQFQGSNRVRSRPSVNTNRGRSGSRTTESSDSVSVSSESTTQSSTSTARSRFTSAPRRFQSSRSRSQSSSSSSSTTSRPASSSSPSVRSRPTSRRPNPVARNRPARPGFLRPRPGSEPEVTETTTPEPEETSPVSKNENIPEETSDESSSEVEETSEEPTTTEANRFSALFRPRNRNALGNRPRPSLGNRPARS